MVVALVLVSTIWILALVGAYGFDCTPYGKARQRRLAALRKARLEAQHELMRTPRRSGSIAEIRAELRESDQRVAENLPDGWVILQAAGGVYGPHKGGRCSFSERVIVNDVYGNRVASLCTGCGKRRYWQPYLDTTSERK
jgi:hypothetical protein